MYSYARDTNTQHTRSPRTVPLALDKPRRGGEGWLPDQMRVLGLRVVVIVTLIHLFNLCDVKRAAAACDVWASRQVGAGRHALWTTLLPLVP